MVSLKYFSKRSKKKKNHLKLVSNSLLSLLTATTALTFTNVNESFFQQEDISVYQGEYQAFETPEYEISNLPLEAPEAEISKEWLAEQKRLEEEAAAKKASEEEAARIEEEERLLAESESFEESSESSEEAHVSPPSYTGGGSKEEWLTAAGIDPSDWTYVDFIVSKESGWNPNAVNPSSGASGLVQALPCGKVPGSCFDPIDNLRWANSYASDRYSGWKGAYEFWINNYWW